MEVLLSSSILLIILVSLFFLLLPLIAIVSVLTSRFEDSTAKIVWILVIFFIPFLGSILYFAIGRNKRIRDNGTNQF